MIYIYKKERDKSKFNTHHSYKEGRKLRGHFPGTPLPKKRTLYKHVRRFPAPVAILDRRIRRRSHVMRKK